MSFKEYSQSVEEMFAKEKKKHPFLKVLTKRNLKIFFAIILAIIFVYTTVMIYRLNSSDNWYFIVGGLSGAGVLRILIPGPSGDLCDVDNTE